MTNSGASPVTRETNATYRRRPLIVTVTGHLLVMREKGRRLKFDVSIDAVYDLAMKLQARAAREEKKARRLGR